MAGLTEKQRDFVREYLVDLNGTRAYMQVYEKVIGENTAKANASRMLANVSIQTAIAAARAARIERVEVQSKKPWLRRLPTAPGVTTAPWGNHRRIRPLAGFL